MAFDYTDVALATPLIRAILNNEREGVREALSHGFSVNLPDNRGWTPIHEAAVSNARCDCLKELLLNSLVNVNAQTFLGETALFLSCQNDSFEAVKSLLKHPKRNINLCNNEGVSPLHIACNKGNFQVIKLLIEAGAIVNSQDFNGYTPLHELVACGKEIQDARDKISVDICQYLMNHGANPNIAEYEGNYPFHLACQNGLKRSVCLLHKRTKEPNVINVCNNDGRSPLMMAVQSQNLNVIKFLLSHEADPNVADNCSVIALHLAAHSGNYELFDLIHKATNIECIIKFCTFDEQKDFDNILIRKKIHSVICLAIDTEDVLFLTKVLESDLNQDALQCPVIHAENLANKNFTLLTPISFLLESKMSDLGENILDFLNTLIIHKSPLKVTSKNVLITYINPMCAALVALNDCPVGIVIKCLKVLLENGADPDEPCGILPFAMEQACMRGCVEAVLLLLQYSNDLEPDDVISWIEQETSSGQEKIVKLLLPLTPYYKMINQPNLTNSLRKVFLEQNVYPLSFYCRAVIRKQIREEIKSTHTSFQQRLLQLMIPKDLYLFLKYK